MTDNTIYNTMTSKDNKLKTMTVGLNQPELMSKLKDYAYGWKKVVFIRPENSDDEIPVQIIPIRYAENPDLKDTDLKDREQSELTHDRGGAIYELFTRWTTAGLNKYKASDPFHSIEFQRYIEEKYDYSGSDYVIFEV